MRNNRIIAGARLRQTATLPHWVRLGALLCVTCFLLASSRGLLPGLCLTIRTVAPVQSVIDHDTIVGPQRSCCRFSQPDAPGNSGPVEGGPGCALCSLAKTPFEPLQQALCPLPAYLPFPPLPQCSPFAVERIPVDPANPRAPPASFAIA